ncbi:MAG: Crp/Fnr family transcriptional regulator [Anaerolineales bacterium]
MRGDPADASVHPPQAFRHADLLAGLTDDELVAVASHFKQAQYESGQTILLEGEAARAFHLVSNGKVKVFQTSADGDEVILHIFEPGGVIGALPVAGEESYPASAAALEPVETYFITAGAFEALMLQYPTMTRNLLRFATRMLQSAHRRLREMATERVERRIARTLARLVAQLGEQRTGEIAIDAPLSRQDLAEMSGTTLYTVSRTLKQWQRQGIVRAGRKRITVTEPHRLIEIAEDLPATSIS